MKESNLVELFKTLNTKELKEFSLFLNSPYFDRGKYRKEVKIMFEVLAKHASSGWETADLTKEKVYKKVFPSASFVEGRLEKVMVEYSKSLRNFLLVQRYLGEENQNNAQADFAGILQNRQLFQRAKQVAWLLLDELKKHEKKDMNSYDLLRKTSYICHEIEAYKNTWREDLNIGQTLRYLDFHYSSARLRLLNHYLLVADVAQVDAGVNIDKEIITNKYIKIFEEESPSIYIAQKIFEFQIQPQQSPDTLKFLVNLVHKHEGKLNIEEIQMFFALIRSFYAKFSRGGRNDLNSDFYQILRDNLSKGYFYYNNQIPAGSFWNITHYALKEGDIEWAYQFIISHKNRIVGDNSSHDYYYFNLANYFFFIGEYQKSLDNIPDFFSNIIYYSLSRGLEILNYYELNSDLLYPKLDAFKMYLNRGRRTLLSEEVYEQNNNFVNLLYQIIKSKPGDTTRKDVLLKRIEEKKQLVHKDWLIAKVKELK